MFSQFFSTAPTKKKRFLRFLVVGAVGTGLDLGVLTLLKIAGMSTLLANSLSFCAGVISNFTGNRTWTFADRRTSSWPKQLAQFVVVSVIGLTLNNLLVITLEGYFHTGFGLGDWSYLPAKGIATSLVVFWNYFANRAWTFRAQPSTGAEPGMNTEVHA